MFLLASEPLLTEELQRSRGLPETRTNKEYLDEWEVKFGQMNPDFFETPAMRETSWRGARRKGRHLITRGPYMDFMGILVKGDGRTRCRRSGSAGNNARGIMYISVGKGTR